MKVLFLVICLLNLLLFFWEFHRGALNPPRQPHAFLPTIMLAGEMERARRGAAVSAYLDRDLPELEHPREAWTTGAPLVNPRPVDYKQMVAETQQTACYEFGPFSTRPSAVSWLSAQGYNGELFYKEELIPSAYLVYYPSAKDPEQTRIHKMMLNAKGITDIWVVPGGELKGALSLGLFNDQARAVSLKNQLLQRGLAVEIKERFKHQSSLYVRIRSDGKIQVRAAGKTLAGCAKY